jgi:hypothetical protein
MVVHSAWLTLKNLTGTSSVTAPTQFAPKARFTAHLLDASLKQTTAALLDLVDQKRQHHQVHQQRGQVLVAVTNVMLERCRFSRLEYRPAASPAYAAD